MGILRGSRGLRGEPAYFEFVGFFSFAAGKRTVAIAIGITILFTILIRRFKVAIDSIRKIATPILPYLPCPGYRDQGAIRLATIPRGGSRGIFLERGYTRRNIRATPRSARSYDVVAPLYLARVGFFSFAARKITVASVTTIIMLIRNTTG